MDTGTCRLVNTDIIGGYSHTLTDGRRVYTCIDRYGNVYQTADPDRPGYRIGNSAPDGDGHANTRADHPDSAGDGAHVLRSDVG